MTAIASAFTSEGFVIGADGRQLDRDKKIFSESSQKIFNFKSRQVDVAYAWCGETSVISQSNEVLEYSIFLRHDSGTRVGLSSAVQIAGTQFPSLIQQCCGGIYGGIIKSPIVRQITNPDSVPESKARMLLNGYFLRTAVYGHESSCPEKTDRDKSAGRKSFNAHTLAYEEFVQRLYAPK